MSRTKIIAAAWLGIVSLLSSSPSSVQGADADHPVVVLDTSAGPITVELDRAKAPVSVDNFLKYVDKGFYDGTTFHRVMKGFMIQTGGMTEANGVLTDKPPLFGQIKNESANGLSNTRGAIAMARTSALDSATSQFYINHVDNPALDSGRYAVFGKVIDGMNVVDEIASVKTTTKPGTMGMNQNVPVKVVTLKSVKRKQ